MPAPAGDRDPWVSRLVGLLRPAAVSVLSVLAVVAAFESGTRAAGVRFPAIARPGISDRDLWVHDTTKGWFHAPGTSGVSYRGGPDRGIVRISSRGLRGREVAKAKRDGSTRILVLGDSFAFGVGVDEEHVFSSQLERLLNQGSRAHFEVVNMGVAGYSTDQEYVLLSELGLDLGPDIVILVACDNDFEGNTLDFMYQRYYKPYFELAGEGRLALRGVPVPRLSPSQSMKLWCAERSNLWNFLRSRRPGNPAYQGAFDFFQVGVARPSATDPVEVTFALIDAFRKTVEGAGARFLVMNTGHRGEQTGLFQALNLAREPRIRYLGMEGPLGKARRDVPEGLWDFPQDSHWNVDSHLLAAKLVHRYLLHEWLRGGGGPP